MTLRSTYQELVAINSLPTQGRFFIQYHSYEKLRYLPAGYEPEAAVSDFSRLDTSECELSCISTNKTLIYDTVNNVVFMIVGYGTPRKYVLWSWCRIEIVGDGSSKKYDAAGAGSVLNPPAQLIGTEFEELKKRMGSFSLGLTEITDNPYLSELISLAKRFGGFKSGRPTTSGKPSIEPASDSNEELPAPGVPETVWRAIKERRGQAKFRRKLLDAYGRRCAITGCDAEDALEAAHIRRHAETGSQHVTDGLLLRADIHTLFDLDLIRINPETLKVVLAGRLIKTSYGKLEGRCLRKPKRAADKPSDEALRARWNEGG